MRTYLVHTFGVIEAIFDIPTLSRVTGVGDFNPQGVFPQYLSSGWKFKNRLDDPKCMHQMSYHAKFQVNTMIRLGCRGVG